MSRQSGGDISPKSIHQTTTTTTISPACQIDATSEITIDAEEDELFLESDCYVKVDDDNA